MAFTTCSVATNNIASLDDLPNDVGGLTATELKAMFDKFGADFVAWFNATHIVEGDAHLNETVSKVVLVTEPYDQVTKTTVNLGFRPKLVNIAGVILATNYESYGFADATGQNCLNSVVKTAVVKSISSAVMVAFTYDATNYLHGIVTITATGIEIAWTLEGTLTGASGNRRIIISAITH